MPGGAVSDGGLNDILGNLGGVLSGISTKASGNTRSSVSSEHSGDGFSGLGNILGGALGDIARSMGSGNQVATGGLGALVGALIGGGSSSAKGAVGGGVMAVLGSLAYSALKNAGSAPTRAPVGLIDNQTTEQKTQMDREADLAIRAMINAAKGAPQVAAQVYIASLLAIEVDTQAEQAYMQQLAEGLGLSQDVVSHIETTIGVR